MDQGGLDGGHALPGHWQHQTIIVAYPQLRALKYTVGWSARQSCTHVVWCIVLASTAVVEFTERAEGHASNVWRLAGSGRRYNAATCLVTRVVMVRSIESVRSCMTRWYTLHSPQVF
jgi:hypothetical protein